MSKKSLKILVSGDVNGQFDTLFARINSIQKKSGAFDLLLCVGDFFGDNDDQWNKYKSGSVKVPIAVLVLGPNSPDHVNKYTDKQGGDLCTNVTYLDHVNKYTDKQGGDLCTNVTYLGKKGLYTGSSGLQLAYLSGRESDIISDDTHFTTIDVNSLVDPVKSDFKFKGVDILITSQWPKGIEKYATEVEGFTSQSGGSDTISQLAVRLRPRYHFSGLEDVHYERQPYRNHKVLQESARHVTRFIGLAKVGNKQKKKYLYAFSITPLSQLDSTELNSQPGDVTETPYQTKSFQSAGDDEKEQFFYDMKGGGQKRKNPNSDKGQQKRHREQPVPTGPCWFCLGGAEVEKHLVVSVAEETYVALAKGGLVDDHVLILPIGHYQSSTSAPDTVIEEIEKYKHALKKCFKKQGKSVVFFERNYKTQHLQIQAIPIPADSIQDIKDVFLECAESESIDLGEIPKHTDIRQIVGEGTPYFYAELPTGEKLYTRISKRFPLQFGREAVASPAILNMPERVDWKVCSIPKSRQETLAAQFKERFKKYDFSLD